MESYSLLNTVVTLAVKTGALVILAWVMSSWFFPKIFKILARSGELLFIVSLAWCFIYAILAVSLGFSLEIGAFLAGISLASLPYSIEIVGRIKSLRDFFIILFFVVLGTELNLAHLSDWRLIFFLVILAILVKPFLVIISLGLQGLRRRTAFLTGLSLGQMSEFSLILSGLALELNLIEEQIGSVLTVTTALSLLISPYLINNADKIFAQIRTLLIIFERRSGKKYSLEDIDDQNFENHVIIFGYHRLGYHILKTLKKLDHKVVVIDFNPEVVDKLREQHIPAIFGDAQDEELLESINLNKARMIISTIPHREETAFLVHKIRTLHRSIITIVTGKSVDDALDYYKNGADYVILPEQISGEHVADLLGEYEQKNLKKLLKHKAEELRLLRTKKHALYLE